MLSCLCPQRVRRQGSILMNCYAAALIFMFVGDLLMIAGAAGGFSLGGSPSPGSIPWLIFALGFYGTIIILLLSTERKK